MALTGVRLAIYRGQGQTDEVLIKATADASYPTGGYPVLPSIFGLNRFETDGQGTGLPPVVGFYTIDADAMGTPQTWFASVNPANGNLQLFVTTTGVEVVAATNVSTFSCLLTAYGA